MKRNIQITFIALVAILLIPAFSPAQNNSDSGLNGNIGVVTGSKGEASMTISTDSYHRVTRSISIGPSIEASPVGDTRYFAGAMMIRINSNNRPIQLTPFAGVGYIYSRYKEEAPGGAVEYEADGYFVPFGLTARLKIGSLISLLGTAMARYHDLDYGGTVGEDLFSYSFSAGFILHI